MGVMGDGLGPAVTNDGEGLGGDRRMGISVYSTTYRKNRKNRQALHESAGKGGCQGCTLPSDSCRIIFSHPPANGCPDGAREAHSWPDLNVDFQLHLAGCKLGSRCDRNPVCTCRGRQVGRRRLAIGRQRRLADSACWVAWATTIAAV